VFVRPSQVHIIDARPQDEYEDTSLVQEDISLDEIQHETIPEDDETFVVPQPPKASRVCMAITQASKYIRKNRNADFFMYSLIDEIGLAPPICSFLICAFKLDITTTYYTKRESTTKCTTSVKSHFKQLFGSCFSICIAQTFAWETFIQYPSRSDGR
jgi:hypothetical protein